MLIHTFWLKINQNKEIDQEHVEEDLDGYDAEDNNLDPVDQVCFNLIKILVSHNFV